MTDTTQGFEQSVDAAAQFYVPRAPHEEPIPEKEYTIFLDNGMVLTCRIGTSEAEFIKNLMEPGMVSVLGQGQLPGYTKPIWGPMWFATDKVVGFAAALADEYPEVKAHLQALQAQEQGIAGQAFTAEQIERMMGHQVSNENSDLEN